MVQVFRKNPEANKFAGMLYKTKMTVSGQALQKMYSESYESKVLGYTLYDTGATDFGLRFNREFFADNFSQIIDAYGNLGVLDVYYYLIRAALGPQTQVTFSSPAPAHLIVDIQEASTRQPWVTQGGELVKATAGTGGDFDLKYTTSEYTLLQAIKMLETISPGGIYVEYKFAGVK